MKHTKSNIIKVLEARKELCWTLYKYAKRDGHIEEAKGHFAEWSGINTSLLLLTDKSFFDTMVEIYKENIE